jgi:alginate O-acetyltransferase complex protein AlgI
MLAKSIRPILGPRQHKEGQLMSFTSLQFIFVFLPVAYLGFVLAHRFGGAQQAINLLATVSLVFYAMWGLPLLGILIVSMIFNFTVGNVITCLNGSPRVSKNLLFGSVAANLIMLGYLKYTNFFIDVANQFSGAGIDHLSIVAPLGVSFFTFVQIGYLIDAYNGKLLQHNFTRYIVFTAFFPCVTAGPLVMQREMMEQLSDPKFPAFDPRRLMIGITMFAMGLCKKVLLADSIAPFADSVFAGAQHGVAMSMGSSWIGALSYTLQLYFDFSGYSDMAIGLATIFAIKLPLNFDSPLKSTNISDFWRRWHMTMTRFFTAYIYSGLAMEGMRKGMSLRMGRVGKFILAAAFPSICTFMLAGVWHGAGWNFLIYGLMHGIAIAIFLAWREFSPYRLPYHLAWLLTMLTVVCGLVMFRAPDLTTALTLFSNMFGLHGLRIDSAVLTIDTAQALSLIVITGAVALLLPNTQQFLHREWPVVDAMPSGTSLAAGLVAWKPNLSSAFLSACVLAVGIASIGSSSGFLYYKF